MLDEIKGYANRHNAQKKLESVLTKYDEKFNSYIVVNNNDRFIPMVVLRESQSWLAGSLAHDGIYVTN